DRSRVDVALDLSRPRDRDPPTDPDGALAVPVDHDVLVPRDLPDEPGLGPEDRRGRARGRGGDASRGTLGYRGFLRGAAALAKNRHRNVPFGPARETRSRLEE